MSKRIPDPFTLVIFGASGDLTSRKLLPAVYSLFRLGFLPEKFSVVGFARREQTDHGFAEAMRKAVQAFGRIPPDSEESWDRFRSRLFYHRGDFGNPEDFRSLRERLEGIAKTDGVPLNCLFYLAT